MREDEIKILKRAIYFSPIIGLVVGLAYNLAKYIWGWSLGFTNIETLATIIAGFSFTMLGFLAAIAAFIFSLQKYKFFRRWVNDGGSDVFFCLYKTAIIWLFFTFAVSLMIFTNVGKGIAFQIMMMSVINNIIQTALLTLIITDKVSKSKKSEET